MQIKANQAKYPFSGDGLEGAVLWVNDPETHPGEPARYLTTLDPRDMMKQHDDADKTLGVRGIPTYIAMVAGELWVYPIPDKDYVARVRYSTVREM